MQERAQTLAPLWEGAGLQVRCSSPRSVHVYPRRMRDTYCRHLLGVPEYGVRTCQLPFRVSLALFGLAQYAVTYLTS